MIYSIKIKLPDSIDNESIFNSIETIFCQNNFTVVRNNDKLVFERMTSKRGANKFQILIELFKAFTQGTIYIDSISQKELICKIYYFKQLIVSLVLGLIICSIFSLYTGNFLTPFLRFGLPFTIIYLAIGIMIGNSMVNELLRKAIK
jgi:hypothetical protein